jgi:hypothetical protein
MLSHYVLFKIDSSSSGSSDSFESSSIQKTSEPAPSVAAHMKDNINIAIQLLDLETQNAAVSSPMDGLNPFK